MNDHPHPDLRILTDLDDSSSSEQDLTRMCLLSPSVLAVGAFLEDIGDPRCLLHEAAAPPTALGCELVPVSAAAAAQGSGALSEASTTRKFGASNLPEHTCDARVATQGAAATNTSIVPRRGNRGGGKRRAKATFNGSAIDHNTEISEKREAMANPSRDRLKEELVHLKGKVTNLERELLRLRSKPKSSAAVVIGSQRDQPQPKSRRLVPHRPIWERLANSANDRKRNSEMENDRLREVVEAQARLSKTLQRMFTKASNPTISDPLIRLASSRAFSAEVDPNSSANEDDHVFQELVSQLDLQYQHLSIVQSETGLAQRTKEGQQSEIRPLNSSDGTLMIECCDVKHFPFAIDAVADAGWQCMTTETMKDVNYTATVVHKTDNFALTKSTIAVKTSNEPDRILRAKNVMKRFSEPHRRVLLFNSVTDLSSRTCGNLEGDRQGTDSGLQFSDQGWATIESTSDASRWPACVLRMCMRVRPEAHPSAAPFVPHGAEAQDAASTTLPALLVDMCTQIIRARHQVVENFLMENLIAQRC